MSALTIEQAANELSVSRDTIERAIKKNQLRASKIGDWRIKKEDLDAYFDSRATTIKKKKSVNSFHE